MEKREFQAESKRLLDLMINSIYTNKEIFLRELISNASDAIDKIYYRTLVDEDLSFNKEDYFIEIEINKGERLLTVKDTGIGMTDEEMDKNLGVIAKSGSLDFKDKNEAQDGYDIIGQFGVGFYSAFMVADKIEVISRSLDSDKAYKWTSTGEDGYTIEEAEKNKPGTEIILHIKEDSEDYNYSDFLEEFRLGEIVKKYSDYIRYPIRMEVTTSRLKEGSEDEYEEVRELKTLNSMVPIWRKNKKELKEEDYKNFYRDKRFGFDDPLHYVHMKVDGLLRFDSILYIPSTPPFDFYTKDYEKGLELYSSGVLIMEKCSDLLPDYLSFVKGVVDSEDLSLNISREILQQTRELNLIASNIEKKLRDELKNLMEKDREKYEKFFESFGNNLKFGIYDNFGRDKDKLQDLVLFYSSQDKKLVSFKEYLSRAKEDQKYIYYASGESLDRIDKMPQVELLKDKGFEIIYLTDQIDEFVIKMMHKYDEFEFRSVLSDDLGIELEEDKEASETLEEKEDLFKAMEEILKDRVIKVRPSKRLKNNPVAFATEGEVSIEMEKLLNEMPEAGEVKASKVLDINMDHSLFKNLEASYKEDKDKFKLITELLYDQANLIEGLPIEDPIKFTNNIWKLV